MGAKELNMRWWWRWYLRKYQLYYCGIVPILGLTTDPNIGSQDVVTEAMLDQLGVADGSLTTQQRTDLKNAGTVLGTDPNVEEPTSAPATPPAE